MRLLGVVALFAFTVGAAAPRSAQECADIYIGEVRGPKPPDVDCARQRDALERWDRLVQCLASFGSKPDKDDRPAFVGNLKKCEADAAEAARREGQRKAAEDRRRAEEDQRRAEEAAEEEAKRAFYAEREALRKDPAAHVLMASAALCFFADARKHNLAQIAQEKKYAQLGGVFDKVKMYELQNNVRRSDEGTVAAKKLLGKRKAKACTDKEVRLLDDCYRAAYLGQDDEKCGQLGATIDVAHEFIAQLDPDPEERQ
jgi:hypothetical protein